MEFLEDYCKAAEAQAVKNIHQIVLTSQYSARIKMKLIYEQHIICAVAVNSLITEASAPKEKDLQETAN